MAASVPREYDTWCYGLNLLFDIFTLFLSARGSTDIALPGSDYDSDDKAYKIGKIQPIQLLSTIFIL